MPRGGATRPTATAPSLLKDHSGYQGIPAYQALPGLRSLEAYEQRYRDEIRHVDLHIARLVAGGGCPRAAALGGAHRGSRRGLR